jgi:hypothetical protein
MYDVALRKKLRFSSTRGELGLEQLWEVPLRAKTGDDFNLNSIAQAANKVVKETVEESFVPTRKTSAQAQAELKLDIVKHVIDVKMDEETAAKRRADNAKKREKILEAMEVKENSKLEGMSMAKLKDELAALDDD